MNIIELHPDKAYAVRLRDVSFRKYFKSEDIAAVKECAVALRQIPRLVNDTSSSSGYAIESGKRIHDLPIYLNGEVMRQHLFSEKGVRDSYMCIDLYMKGSMEDAFRWYVALHTAEEFMQLPNEHDQVINPFYMGVHTDPINVDTVDTAAPKTLEAVFAYDSEHVVPKRSILKPSTWLRDLSGHSPINVHLLSSLVR